MPGNEVGDSIHNFLGQESLSLGQHHSQLIDSTWPGLSNNLWVESQRQVGPLVSSVKNLSVHQLAEFDRGHTGQTSSLQHGLNFTQSGMRSEIARNHSQNQSSIATGYMQVHQGFQARQNNTNFLGVDTASRCLPVLDSHIESGPDLHEKNSLRLESTASPVNYDFLGGQPHVNGQHPGMIQPLPRQQSGMTGTQLLQQHSILKQMQEFQRQQFPNPQQLQEARQLSSMNQVSSFVKQGSGSLSPATINGVPVHDASNYSLQPELMTSNANWLQHDAFSALQGSSGGFMFSPVQSQVRLMGLDPQQDNQSFNGVFNGSARGNQYQYLSVQMDKPLLQQVPASSNSFPGNQHAMFSDEVVLQDGTLLSRQVDLGKNLFGAAAVQDLNSVFHSENLQQMTIQPKSALMESHGRQEEHLGPSETSLEKSAIQAVHSQNVASLDPTEEKILFGSDDSVWDIFGKSTNTSAVLDGTDSFGAFPSLQSGSWSALMQAAVAETSSNDIGVQEEWSGLALQTSEPPSGNMPSLISNDGSQQQLPGVDNNLQNASTVNFKPFPMSMDANINRDFGSTLGVQQSGVQTANEQTGRMHNDSCQRFVQQLTEERSKWLDRSPLEKPAAESASLFGNVAHSPDVQASAKSISGHQGMALFNPHGQPHNKPNDWNFIESASRSGGAVSNSQDIESSSQPSQSSDHKGGLYEERGLGSDLDHPLSDVNIGPGNVDSGLGSPQVNEGSGLGNVAAVTDSRTRRVTKESSQQLPNGHNLNLWKNIDSKVNSGPSRTPANYQQNLDKSPLSFDSSRNNCLEKGLSEANMLENSNVKETSNDSFHSNLSQHTSTGGIIGNGWLDANDPLAGEQKSSVHVSCKPSGAYKFQYHPMGDLDAEVETSYGTKNLTHMQAIAHVSQGFKGHDQGYFVQSNYTVHAAGKSTETEKGCIPCIQVEEMPSTPGSAPGRSFNFIPNKTASISQNMLELLQKVDQPREPGTATHLSSSERNQSSEMPDAETSDGSVGQFQHNRPSASQCFGLQLGPPSQRFTIPDRSFSSQSSPQRVNSLNSVHISSEARMKGHTLVGPTASVQSPHGESNGDSRNSISRVSGHTNYKASEHNIVGNVSAGFTSDYPYLESHLQCQHVIDVGNQVIPNKFVNADFSGLTCQSKRIDDSYERAQISQLGRISAPRMPKSATDDLSSSETSWPSYGTQNNARVTDQQFPVLEAMPASQPSGGAFTKMPNVWTSVSAAQHLLGAQSSWASQNLLKHQQQSNDNSETTLPGEKKLDDQIAWVGGNGATEFPAGSAKPHNSGREEQPAKGQQLLPEADASQNPASMQRDIEAFGRSLRPNNTVHQNYLLLHQVQAVKNIQIDPSNRSVKRFKGPTPDSALDAQQKSQGADLLPYGSNNMMRDALMSSSIVPSGDSKMLNMSSGAGEYTERQSSANDTLAFVQNDSLNFNNANNSAGSDRSEHPQIRPQMAPSWFDEYGAFKKGQMLPIYDAQKIATMKAADKGFIVGRPSDNLHALDSSEQVNAADASQLDGTRQNSNLMPIAIGHISRQLLPPGIPNQNLIVMRAKKRKSMTFELVSWHREVTQGRSRPQDISAAEAGWAHAANRLIEAENEPEMIEDWPPVLRSKRRLILTTQLMQQLHCAPPRAVLSADAIKNYETVVYFVARLGLGEACSSAYICESDTAVPSESGSTLPEKLKKRKQSILKAAEQFVIAAEQFVITAKKLENDLQSLDKRSSILDLRLECQDLEKISLINRFAKFYGRGQADRAETSSTSEAIASPPKFFIQRYVSAVPMPRNVPDKVQCLPL
ncbi:hypothetical protein ES319_D12G205300v1 [Gossypium barbadense]|uniref:Regulatory E2 n=2 Tax=Gossypium TaxID=3633 RepID=A0A5J5P4X1_GOSBA|nr:hypothetical protein ES319_D12G205300v1 [Gossypium barbadense]KAB2000061.1 hypothetical protein ES319_D12G205300v1 [Gossypium barbadense]TYG41941.1 hypothetical protein ES288_D12G216700v1 [Gossypium darwinii]